MKIAYISNDGQIFYSERECRDWERKCKLADADNVMNDHVILFGRDRYGKLIKLTYDQGNRASYAYVKQLTYDNRIHELYSLFIPWDLGDAIDQCDEIGWYVLDSDIDKWTTWDNMKQEMEHLKQVEEDINVLDDLLTDS